MKPLPFEGKMSMLIGEKSPYLVGLVPATFRLQAIILASSPLVVTPIILHMST